MNGTMPVLSIDPRAGTVSGPGGDVRLEPKVMDVLIVLARYSGHVVSRSDLLDSVWGKTIVTEQTLSRCIYQLREQLRQIGTKNGDQEFNAIETLPKRGYRLLAKIEQAPSELRLTNDSLLIELKRPKMLFWGLAVFATAMIALFVFVLN